MKTVLAIFAAVLLNFAAKAGDLPPDAKSTAISIGLKLPEGWNYQLTSEKGGVGNPYGLEEALFRIDFVNTNEMLHVMEKDPEWLTRRYDEFRKVQNQGFAKGETNAVKLAELWEKTKANYTNEIEVASIHPNFRLYFYEKKNREQLLDRIKQLQIFSYNNPFLFGETKDFLIVESWGFRNRFSAQGSYGSDFGQEGKKMLKPLFESLDKYINEHQ